MHSESFISSNSDEFSVSYGKIGTGLVLSTLLAVYASWASPRFAQLFQGFGATLPFSTELVLSYYPLLLLLPLTVLAVALFHPDRAARGRIYLIVGLFGSVGLFVLINVALYIPVYKMGAVTQ